jgi:hypothetical protein
VADRRLVAAVDRLAAAVTSLAGAVRRPARCPHCGKTTDQLTPLMDWADDAPDDPKPVR